MPTGISNQHVLTSEKKKKSSEIPQGIDNSSRSISLSASVFLVVLLFSSKSEAVIEKSKLEPSLEDL